MKVVILLKVTKIMLKILIVVILFFILSSILNLNVRVSKHKISTFEIWKKKSFARNVHSRATKYVLVWTKGDKNWDCLKHEREAFIDNNCEYDNCFITYDRDLLNKDYRNFHAILIDGKAISLHKNYSLPEKRSPEQLYVFANKESAEYYPVCDKKFDNYFNLTWTNRLYSDAKWTYFTIYNKDNEAVGPRKNMNWTDYEKDPVDYDLVTVLRKKQQAALWFVSNCYTKGGRESIVNNLRFVLQNHEMTIDIVGECGIKKCPIKEDEKCMKMLEKYYFYLAFEKAVAEDYVTDIVLKPLWNYAIPVVYGAINYSNFLPPHSYIDAANLGYEDTAQKMIDLIRNKNAYLEYFKWRKHYHYSRQTKSVCELCEAINKNNTSTQVYKTFRNWWYPVFELYDICGDDINSHATKETFNTNMREDLN